MSVDMVDAPVAVQAEPCAEAVSRARTSLVGSPWPLRERLAVLARFRHRLAKEGPALARRLAAGRATEAEVLTSEVIPLAEACRFLERRATRILRPQVAGRRDRPAWLGGVALEVHREPHGIVLIVGPWNYPLFLVGVQAVQALAAGNVVLIKPAAGGIDAAMWIAGALRDAGVPDGWVAVLPEAIESTARALDAGVDHVVFTGSAAAGEAVARACAERLVPACLELSGCDAAFVLDASGAETAGRCLAFGVSLNGGATCIAPRRAFVPTDLFAATRDALLRTLAERPPVHPARPADAERAMALVRDAESRGARRLAHEAEWPIVLTDVPRGAPILAQDVFAPVLCLLDVPDPEAALAWNADCPFALGASVFGENQAARAFAARVSAGCVVVNDMIVPTADPRLPFSGRGRSGYGATRGAEGLLAMTRVKAIARRTGRWRPHLDPPHPSDAALFGGFLALAHGGTLRERLAGLAALARAGRGRSTPRRDSTGGRSGPRAE